MLLSGDKAQEIFTKIKHIREEVKAYFLAPDRPALSVEELQEVICAVCSVKIEKYEVEFESERLRAMIERYNDKAIIYIKAGLDQSFARFLAVKEMFHVVLDNEGDWSVDGVSTIESLLSDIRLKDNMAANSTHSEIFAEIAALELLYPCNERRTDMAKLKTGELTITQIARYYEVPTLYVTRVLSEKYQTTVEGIWGSVKDGI